MKLHLTKESIAAIKEAYENDLYIEFYHGDTDYYRYSASKITFNIMRKKDYTYEKIASYNIDKLLTSLDDNLVIYTHCGKVFEFRHKDSMAMSEDD